MTDPKKDACEPTDNKLTGANNPAKRRDNGSSRNTSWTCEKSLKSSASFSTKGSPFTCNRSAELERRGTVDEVTAWVMRGTADVGVTNAMPSHPQFRHIGVFVDRLILCGCPERARQIPDEVSWAKLVDQAPILWEQSELTQTLVAAFAAHRVDVSRLAHPRLRLSSTMAVISVLQGGRYIGLVPERAVSPLLASGMLVRIGLLDIPLRYWMFALRERDIDPLAAQVARSAAYRGAW